MMSEYTNSLMKKVVDLERDLNVSCSKKIK